MFLWTMVLPLKVIEKETQAKPCALPPEVLAQARCPCVSQLARDLGPSFRARLLKPGRPSCRPRVTLCVQRATYAGSARWLCVPRGCPALPMMACPRSRSRDRRGPDCSAPSCLARVLRCCNWPQAGMTKTVDVGTPAPRTRGDQGSAKVSRLLADLRRSRHPRRAGGRDASASVDQRAGSLAVAGPAARVHRHLRSRRSTCRWRVEVRRCRCRTSPTSSRSS